MDCNENDNSYIINIYKNILLKEKFPDCVIQVNEYFLVEFVSAKFNLSLESPFSEKKITHNFSSLSILSKERVIFML